MGKDSKKKTAEKSLKDRILEVVKILNEANLLEEELEVSKKMDEDDLREAFLAACESVDEDKEDDLPSEVVDLYNELTTPPEETPEKKEPEHKKAAPKGKKEPEPKEEPKAAPKGKKEPEPKEEPKKATPKKAAKKDEPKMTRFIATAMVLKNGKPISPEDLAVKANEIYAEAGKGDNLKESKAIVGVGLTFLEELGVIERTDKGLVKFTA